MAPLPAAIRPLARRVLEAHWRLVCRVGRAPEDVAPGTRVGAVLLSYDRPRNIDPILRSLLRGDLVTRVVVCNNNPEFRADQIVSVQDARVATIDHAEPRGPGLRWDVALTELEGMDVVLAIDDDVFAYPSQIEHLIRAVVARPDVPHGMFGRSDREWIEHQNTEVATLCGVYAVHRRHVARYHQILDANPDLRDDVDELGDDILISLTGDSPALVHDVGRVPRCRTSTDPGIALHRRRPSFDTKRRDLERRARRARQELSW